LRAENELKVCFFLLRFTIALVGPVGMGRIDLGLVWFRRMEGVKASDIARPAPVKGHYHKKGRIK